MKNSTEATDIFQFKEEDQPSEMEANRFCSNYTFTRNGAGGANRKSKGTGDELSEDVDGDYSGNIAHSSPNAEDYRDDRINSISRISCTNQRRYPDREPNKRIRGSFLDATLYNETAFPGSPSSDESVGTVSDVDESMSEQSASYSSAIPDHHGILDGPVPEQDFHWGMFENRPIDFLPDYIYYRGTYYTKDTAVTFSSDCVEVKGSTPDGNSETLSIRLGVDDIHQIQSCFLGTHYVAVFNIHANERSTAQAGTFHETSGIEEVEFSVNDFGLSEKCEAIELLGGYKAIWNSHYGSKERTEENSHGETSSQRPKKYFPSYGETLEEVIYPKGDPDAVCLGKRDFDLLAPETFVNDTIIDFYVKYLKNGIPLEKRQRYHFFNSFFFRKLADMDKDPTSAFDGHAAFLRVRKWTRKVDLFEKDFVFIPVNYSYHWSLMVICHPGEVANFTDDTAESAVKVPCILHMDSLRGSHVGLKDLLQRYLLEEWKERTKETSEVVISKFGNLRFISLELPQQQNLSDCGLFLLHYVECFLKEDPAGINPYRIKNNHNGFLSINWFQPHEPSIKRSTIQRLISNLLQKLPLENSPDPRDGLKTSNDDENAVDLVSEQFGSKSSDKFLSSRANEITPCPNSSLGGVSASESALVLSDSFEPESNDQQPLCGVRFGHSASFNEFGSSLPPIQEEVEAPVRLSYKPSESGLLRLGGNRSEPCALDISWMPVGRAVDVELDSSPTTDSENPLEVDVGEQRCKVDEKIDQPESALADCLVDGQATSGELLDITLTECHNGSLACKSLLLIGNGSVSEDPQPNAKRMRLTTLDDKEISFRSSLSNDLHL